MVVIIAEMPKKKSKPEPVVTKEMLEWWSANGKKAARARMDKISAKRHSEISKLGGLASARKRWGWTPPAEEGQVA